LIIAQAATQLISQRVVRRGLMAPVKLASTIVAVFLLNQIPSCEQYKSTSRGRDLIDDVKSASSQSAQSACLCVLDQAANGDDMTAIAKGTNVNHNNLMNNEATNTNGAPAVSCHSNRDRLSNGVGGVGQRRRRTDQ
jgi:hypothetical protein